MLDSASLEDSAMLDSAMLDSFLLDSSLLVPSATLSSASLNTDSSLSPPHATDVSIRQTQNSIKSIGFKTTIDFFIIHPK